jgi:hypothetical protein
VSEIVYEDVLAVVRANRGKKLKTIGGRAEFEVVLDADTIYVIPSTGIRRRLAAGLTRSIERYNETRSLATSDYQSFSKNSSYALRLLAIASGRQL